MSADRSHSPFSSSYQRRQQQQQNQNERQSSQRTSSTSTTTLRTTISAETEAPIDITPSPVGNSRSFHHRHHHQHQSTHHHHNTRRSGAQSDAISYDNMTLSESTVNTALASRDRKIVCYYTNWSQYRPKVGKYVPENIDAHICTHIVFAFGWMKNNKVSAFDSADDTKAGKKGLYARVTEIKSQNPKLKVLLAIGGWSFGTEKFKTMASNKYNRRLFIFSALEFLRARDFDGLDIDWVNYLFFFSHFLCFSLISFPLSNTVSIIFDDT